MAVGVCACVARGVRCLIWLAVGCFLNWYYWDTLVRFNWSVVAPGIGRLLLSKGLKLVFPEPCTSKESLAASSKTNTSLELILPSIGQTGTTSVAQALRDIGYRSYHIEEKCLHGQPLNWDNVAPAVWATRASRCRLAAVSLEPHTDSLYTALLVSPQARVIMTIRDFPSWKKSSIAARGQRGKDVWWPPLYWKIHSSLRFFPWLHLYDAFTGSLSNMLRDGDEFAGFGQITVSKYLVYKSLSMYDNPQMNTFSRGSMRVRPIMDAHAEESYLALHNEIREITPPERLLEFDVRKHGWPELDRFLGRAEHPPGVPFPHPRSKFGWTNDTIIDNNPGTAAMIFAVLISLHVLHAAVLGAGLRAAVHACLYAASALLGRTRGGGISAKSKSA